MSRARVNDRHAAHEVTPTRANVTAPPPPCLPPPATAQGEFTAASRGRDYAAGSLVRSMEWDADLRAGVLGGNALAWMGKTLEDFMR